MSSRALRSAEFFKCVFMILRAPQAERHLVLILGQTVHLCLLSTKYIAKKSGFHYSAGVVFLYRTFRSAFIKNLGQIPQIN